MADDKNEIGPVEELTELVEKTVAEKVEVANPLLQRAKMPGEDHQLPSRGLFYTDGELAPDVTDGEVHIHPLTTLDEINLASPALLYSGKGITQTIAACVPAIKKPERLMAQDVEFILLCLRQVAYGPTFEYHRVHNGCSATPEGEDDKDNIYQADLGKVIAASKKIDMDAFVASNNVTLDGTNQVVKFAPLRYDYYMKLMQTQAQAARKELDSEAEKNLILDHLVGVIEAVDEITDQEMIREWLEVINVAQIKKITTKIDAMAKWGVNAKVKVKCRDCKAKMEVDLPTNPLALFS